MRGAERTPSQWWLTTTRACTSPPHLPHISPTSPPQVAFLALAEVAPVTHAVTNTVKRVVIILASILVFKTTITPLGAAGSAITVAGALLYALAKNKYK